MPKQVCFCFLFHILVFQPFHMLQLADNVEVNIIKLAQVTHFIQLEALFIQ